MRRTRIIILGLVAVAILAGGGCSGQQSTATQAEQNAWKSPPKEPPAGYSDYMATHKGGPPAPATK